MSHEVHIYTDGAAKGNPGPAGYGVVMEMVGTPYKKDFYDNNHMNQEAVVKFNLKFIEYLKSQNIKF